MASTLRPGPTTSSKHGSFNGPILIGVVVTIVIIVLALILFLLHKKRQSTKTVKEIQQQAVVNDSSNITRMLGHV
jgi:flagellar basal body-associated protein FliL